MKQIDRYIGRKLVLTFLRMLIGLVLVFVVVDMLTHRRNDIIRHDVPILGVLEYYLYFIPLVITEYQAAAMAALVSGLLVLGGMTQRNEHVAMLAGGIGIWRIAAAPLVVGLGLTAAVFIFSEWVAPPAADRAYDLEHEYFGRRDSQEREGLTWAHLEDGWRCHVRKFNRTALTGEDVLILAYGEGFVEEIQAGRIYWDPEREQWLLEDGRYSRFADRGPGEAVHDLFSQRPAPFSEPPEVLFALSEAAATKPAGQLRREIEAAASRGQPVSRAAVAYHSKFSRPALCLIMILLAVPFGLRTRYGGLIMSIGVAVGLGLGYLMVFSMAQGLGGLGRIDPIVAAWLANVVFGAAGLVLIYRSPT